VTERDANGRFAKGNSGGPGRTSKTREVRFLEITLATVTFKDWEEIVEKARDQAKRGNPVARKWLGDYLMGPPVQRAELSGPEGGPVEIQINELIVEMPPEDDEPLDAGE